LSGAGIVILRENRVGECTEAVGACQKWEGTKKFSKWSVPDFPGRR
jgi:hypothetical protein